MAELKNLIVNGAARVNGDIYGNLKGNADTATNADKLDGKDSTAFANASHTHTKSDIGLGNVENKSSATIRGEITAENIPSLSASKITSGTFADARIASAANWNGKQDKLTAGSGITIENNVVSTIDILTLDDTQILTPEEKDNVLRKLDIVDERLILTIECDTPSVVVGVIITISYDNNSYQYTYQGQPLSIVIPMFSQYTVSFSNVSGYYRPESFTYMAKRNLVRNITVSYDAAQYIDLSLKDINGNDLTNRNTANCYVIKSTGYYELPLVYGNAITNGETNTSAYTYTQTEGNYTQPFFNYLNKQIKSPFIEIDTDISAESAGIVYSDTSSFLFNINGVKLIQRNLCKYLRFQVDAFPSNGGNAVLCVKDGNEQIMWSWHIWAYGDTLSTIPHTNNTSHTYEMLNVNLGWVKDSAGSTYGTCPYYQWGRKDPMLRPANSSTGTQATLGYGSWSITSTAPSVATTIQNPNIFNTGGSSPYNWWNNDGTSVNFYNYWDASQTSTGNADKTIVKTVYDPCPSGFGIPCGNTFTGFSTSNGGTFDKGYVWDGRYFPASGYRNVGSGGIYGVGSDGYYWLSSSYSEYSAFYLDFYSSRVDPQYDNFRAYGFAVCPVLLRT